MLKVKLSSFLKINLFFFLITISSVGFTKTSLNADKEKGLLVNVKNSLAINRVAETIEVSWKAIAKSNKNINVGNVIVTDANGTQIPSQLIYNGKKKPQSLIFQTDINASASLTFKIDAGDRKKYTSKVYGRYVPERFDDFAWENDKVAFRMYGAALDKQKTGNAKGLDFWSKKTTDLIINKWYKTDNYHVDQGEGMDGYHVGMTLGAGNSAIYKDGKFIFSNNYAEYRILEQGPIRITFDLIYNTWDADGQKVAQIKTISLDAGSNINKITDHYTFKGNELPIAAGVTKHKNDGSIKIDNINNYVSYWDKADGKVDNGMIGVAVLFPKAENVKLIDESDHLLGIKTISRKSTFTYYQGSAWNRSGFFDNETDWLKYLAHFSKALETPLIIEY